MFTDLRWHRQPVPAGLNDTIQAGHCLATGMIAPSSVLSASLQWLVRRGSLVQRPLETVLARVTTIIAATHSFWRGCGYSEHVSHDIVALSDGSVMVHDATGQRCIDSHINRANRKGE